MTAPETSVRFPALQEACKKFRGCNDAKIVIQAKAKPRKRRPAVFDKSQLAALTGPIEAMEKLLRADVLAAYRAEVPRAVQEWQESVPGLGAHGLARLLGETGHPVHAFRFTRRGDDLVLEEEFHRTCRQLRAYTGNGDPARQSGRTGARYRENPGMSQAEMLAGGRSEARLITHIIAQGFVKSTGLMKDGSPRGQRSPYRDIYEQAKEQAAARGWDQQTQRVPFPSNRADMHAYRVVRQRFLDDLWRASRGTCGC